MNKVVKLAIESVELFPEEMAFSAKDLIPMIIWDKLSHGEKTQFGKDFYKVYKICGLERLGKDGDWNSKYKKKANKG